MASLSACASAPEAVPVQSARAARDPAGEALARAERLLGDEVAYHDPARVALALTELDEALRLRPVFARANGLRGFLRMLQGRKEEALVDLDMALSGPKPEAELLRLRGSVRRELGDLDGAIADLSSALAIAPDAATFFERSLALQAKGDLGESLADASTSVRLDSKEVAPRIQRAVLWCNLGHPDLARADLDVAVSLAPADARVWHARALFHLRAGDPLASVRDCEAGLAVAGADVDRAHGLQTCLDEANDALSERAW